jgi:hypothetical protein
VVSEFSLPEIPVSDLHWPILLATIRQRQPRLVA